MSRGRQAQAIKLPRKDRKSLELLTRRGTAEHRQVVRAQVALMCHAGESTTGISEGVDEMFYAASLVATIRASASQTQAMAAQFDLSWLAMRRRARSFQA